MGTELPRLQAFAALERTANRILESERGEDISRDALRGQFESIPEIEHELIEYFFDSVANLSPNDTNRINRDDIYKFLDQEIEHIRAADTDENKLLSSDESAQLNKTGQLAISLASHLQQLDPAPLALRHCLDDLEGKELSKALRDINQAHTELSYSYAKCVLFNEIFNSDESVSEVYAGKSYEMSGSTRSSDSTNLNTEHSWPKSKGIKGTAAVSDLHHLFPVDAEANAKRSSYPFGEVIDVTWEKGDSKLGLNAKGHIVFEPPEEHRGQLARAMFYIHTMYEKPFQPGEESILRTWHAAHPVTDSERARNDAISKHQGTRNPFIDYPDLIDKL